MHDFKAASAKRERDLKEELEDLQEAFEKEKSGLLKMAAAECEVN